MEGLLLGFDTLGPAEQQSLAAADVGLCIFDAKEIGGFIDAGFGRPQTQQPRSAAAGPSSRTPPLSPVPDSPAAMPLEYTGAVAAVSSPRESSAAATPRSRSAAQSTPARERRGAAAPASVVRAEPPTPAGRESGTLATEPVGPGRHQASAHEPCTVVLRSPSFNKLRSPSVSSSFKTPRGPARQLSHAGLYTPAGGGPVEAQGEDIGEAMARQRREVGWPLDARCAPYPECSP